MTFLRKLHLYVGVVLALFLLVQAVTGFLLRLRVSGPATHLVHTWLKYARSGQGIGLLVGLVISVGLAWLAISGVILFVSTQTQKAKRARRRQEQVRPS
jgi:uncharacterized iron-regulated membrane protein